MPGFDLDTAIQQSIQANRNAGAGMLVGAVIGWVVLLGLAGGGGALFAWLGEMGAGAVWLAALVCVGLLALLMAGATLFFYYNKDYELEVRDERTFVEQVTGNHAISAEFGVAMLLVIPQITAVGLRDLSRAKAFPEQHLPNARRIAGELYEKNAWLPLTRYEGHYPCVVALVRLDILHTKLVHGKAHVRLSPSLYG